MDRFNYRAKNAAGEAIAGVVEASNANLAAKLVREKGLVVIALTPQRTSIISLLGKLKGRITLSMIASFTRQLATMINAGLPVTESLLILRNQSKESMQRVVSQLLADVQGGESFSKALAKHPKVFSPTYIALVRSGETGGVLDKVLLRLADTLEKQQEFRGKVKGALIYPAIIIIGMFMVGIVMMVFVIPRMTDLYTEFEADLPVPTKILISISNFMVSFWPVMLILAGGLFYGFSLYRKSPEGRRRTDELILKIPVFGELQKKIILTELTRTLSLMVGSGVSILDGLNITAGVVGNVVISDALNDAAKRIQKGFPLAYSFAKHPDAFPYLLSQMIAVGEETGKMDEVLQKISQIFEEESNQSVKTLSSTIEPVVMILLGIGVAFLVIAVILPIYNLTSQF